MRTHPVGLSDLNDWCDYFDEEPPTDLLDGLVHSASTLITGLNEAGKSFLAVNIVASLVKREDLLGHAHDGRSHRAVYLCRDPGGPFEVTRRLKELLPGREERSRVRLRRAPATNDQASWAELEEELRDATVVVFDNLSGALDGDGDSRHSGAVAPLLERLSDLMDRHGCAVVLLAHSTKQGAPGAAGSIVTSGWARQEIHLRSQSGIRTADVHGNDMREARSFRFRIREDYSLHPAGASPREADKPPRGKLASVQAVIAGKATVDEAVSALLAAGLHTNAASARKYLRRNGLLPDN